MLRIYWRKRDGTYINCCRHRAGRKGFYSSQSSDCNKRAHYLVGGHRALSDYASENQETYAVTGKLAPLAQWIKEALSKDDVVVMVSGDPGYYSLLPWLKKQFPECPLTVIPGISSVQAAYCALAQPWQGSEWLSFHGRVRMMTSLCFLKAGNYPFNGRCT